MSRLDDFLGRVEPTEKPPPPVGMEWDASVLCQTCNERVDKQMLYPTERILTWTCSEGHKSYIEGYSAF